MQFIKFLSIISVAGIFALCFFANFSSDDYCYKQILKEHSVFETAFQQYFTWDGRSLSIPALIQLTALKYFPPWLITFIWALFFAGTGIIICKIISLENPLFGQGPGFIVSTGILSVVLWTGMWKLIPDVVYWPTGGGYSVAVFMGMLWLYIYTKRIRQGNFNSKTYILIFFLSLILGINSHNFLTGIIIFCLIEIIHGFFIIKNTRAVLFTFCALTGIMIASSVVFLAPGNLYRLDAVSGPEFSLGLFYNFCLVLARYIYWFALLFALLIFLIWLSGNNFFENIKSFFLSFFKKQSFAEFIYENKYFLSGLSTLLVFAAIPSFAVPRTGIFFGCFIVIYIFQKMWKAPWSNLSRKFLSGAVFLLMIFIFIISLQLFKANSLNILKNEREIKLIQQKGEDVAVSSINDQNIPLAFTFTDISPDTSYWVNRCVAKYYGLKTVRTNSD